MEDDRKQFSYTYSAKEQEELKRIRDKYLPEKDDKMENLRKLDRSVYKKATIYSLILGIAGALIMGIGMCCTMEWEETMFIPGVVIGLIGVFLLSLAYPAYSRTLKNERKKIAPEIIRLTDELLM